MSAIRKTLAAALAAGAALVAGPAAATAEPAAPTGTRMVVLTVSGQDGTRSASLRCTPDSGSHRDPVAACAELTLVNGVAGNLNVNPDTMCTLEYRPVAATLAGLWDGRLVAYREVFANSCEMRAFTGPVFAI